MQGMKAVVLVAAAALTVPLAQANGDRATRAAEPLLLAQAAKAEAGKETKQMYDHMAMMQKKMDSYHASKDRNERAKLRVELYADMREHMKLMRGASGDTRKRQESMAASLDQMQQMMDWMLTFDSDIRPLGP